MARILILALSLFVFIASPSWADTTSNPSHKGYVKKTDSKGFSVLEPAQWKPYTSKCSNCKPIVESYNAAMQSLFDAKTSLKSLTKLEEGLNDWNEDPARYDYLVGEGGKGVGNEKLLSVMLGLREDMQAIVKEKTAFEQLITNLSMTTRDLRGQISVCEEQCSLPPEESKIIGSLGTPPENKVPALPFDWAGPYKAVCEKCEALAKRLNDLPALALQNLTEMDAQMVKEASLKIDIMYLRMMSFQRVGDTKDAKKRKADADKIEKMQKEIDAIQTHLKRLQNDYKAIKNNFTETLGAYNKCIQTCQGKKEPIKEPIKTGCVFPENRPAIAIGPNDQFGSGKALSDKIEGQAKGVAMGALNGLLGGSGVSLGGGGSKSKEPKTDKDPTSGKFTSVSAGGTDLDIRAGFTNEGLVVSTEIDDTPGDGTFHAQWLEDGAGTIYLPTRYLLIDIYRDWKLSVWWTYDRWVNGDHVEHDEGDSLTVGTDYIGTLAFFEGAKGIANSIWNSMGFDTAVKGVKHLGAFFDVPPAAFEGPCPLQLVTHISLPKEGPVSTVPIVGELFRKGGTPDKNLSVLVRPSIADNAQ